VLYGMGITQYRHGTENVQQLANLLLLRGNIGRQGAGICPLRGHSNVQGDQTVGITERPNAALLDGIEHRFSLPGRQRVDRTRKLRPTLRHSRIQVSASKGHGRQLTPSPSGYPRVVSSDCLPRAPPPYRGGARGRASHTARILLAVTAFMRYISNFIANKATGMKRPRIGRPVLMCLLLTIVLISPAASAADLVVSAASSLTNAFQEVARSYEARHPETHVVLNFASSDTLMRQIANGAPADVFASADQVAMDRAQAQGLIAAGTRTNFAANQLVLIVPSSSHARISSLKDLLAPGFKRIAWGNPASVPVGRYTERVLEDAGLTKALERKAVLAQNVRQCLDYVSRDEVDAGFVYATDAAVASGHVQVALRLPSPQPITYPIAIVAQATHSSAAQSFRRFVLSPEGQALLAKYGFLEP